MNNLSARSCFPAAALSAALVLSFGPSAASAGVVTVSTLAWTTATTSGDLLLVSDGGAAGQGDVTGGTTLVLVGPNDQSFTAAIVTASRVFPQGGLLSFNYLGNTADTGGWGDGDLLHETVGYRVNSGANTILSPVSGTASVSGFTSIPVTAGDTVTFFVDSFDQGFGEATLTLSDLTFTPVPEPAGMAVIAGAGLVGFAAWRRRGTAAR
jgi:hypothetical protein